MDAVKFLKECQRLETTDPKLYSEELMMTDKTFEERVAFVEQWSKEHPQKTRMQDLLDKYPKAAITKAGDPRSCCVHLGYIEVCPGGSCIECWNTPIEED